ncbi:MAG: sigma-70 domain-containing protein, partial [Bradymonadia bacterium]
ISFANTRAGRKLFFRLEKERARLMQEHGEATTLQLAESLDVSEDDVVAATLLRQPTLSLTGPKGRSGDGDTRTVGDTIADENVDVEDTVVHADLLHTVDAQMKEFAKQLTDEREQTIWKERMIAQEPVSLAELGARYDISRERVRQVEARLKKRLKEFLTERLGESLILDFTSDD